LGLLNRLTTGDTRSEQRHSGVLRTRQGGKQVVLLINKTEILPTKANTLARRKLFEILPEECHFAVRAIEQSGNNRNQCSLSAAAWATEEGQFSELLFNIPTAQDPDASVPFAEIFDNVPAFNRQCFCAHSSFCFFVLLWGITLGKRSRAPTPKLAANSKCSRQSLQRGCSRR